ncbi:hypothetical protein FOZ62_008350 [Perkinsus olseni]|uniref:Uncharacterized protein n=1 Tax=Perkinsus olseni TaxID=32597 RepID=A0A7J6U2B2_PEROL|nr:hypothetical protein FOZ62_008350 [Perkinsus olseni]
MTNQQNTRHYFALKLLLVGFWDVGVDLISIGRPPKSSTRTPSGPAHDKSEVCDTNLVKSTEAVMFKHKQARTLTDETKFGDRITLLPPSTARTSHSI